MLLAVALLACGLAALFSRKCEPSYRGRKLSEWVATHSGGYSNASAAAERHEAAEAIRQVGASAIPWLLAWTDYEPPKWEHSVKTMIAEAPNRIFQEQPVEIVGTPPTPAPRAERRAAAAAEAFAALGSLATPAIPELVRRINATNCPFRRCIAMLALSHLGSHAVPTMATVLSNPIQPADFCAAECIRNLGTNALPLVPLLIANVQHTNWRAAAVSARALGDTNFAPDLVVRLLTECLRHPRKEVRMEAPLALMEFGALARSALPTLSNAAADGSFEVRLNAIIAIQQIVSDATTNAPAQ